MNLTKTTALIILAAILWTGIAAAAPAPVYPGMNDAIPDLEHMHPVVLNNPIIKSYVAECGIGTWHEERNEKGHRFVHLLPAGACKKQLVFSDTPLPDYPPEEPVIWILDAGETWSETMNPVSPSLPPAMAAMLAALALGLAAIIVALAVGRKQ